MNKLHSRSVDPSSKVGDQKKRAGRTTALAFAAMLLLAACAEKEVTPKQFDTFSQAKTALDKLATKYEQSNEEVNEKTVEETYETLAGALPKVKQETKAWLTETTESRAGVYSYTDPEDDHEKTIVVSEEEFEDGSRIRDITTTVRFESGSRDTYLRIETDKAGRESISFNHSSFQEYSDGSTGTSSKGTTFDGPEVSTYSDLDGDWRLSSQYTFDGQVFRGEREIPVEADQVDYQASQLNEGVNLVTDYMNWINTALATATSKPL